jgi:hypothetical protein
MIDCKNCGNELRYISEWPHNQGIGRYVHANRDDDKNCNKPKPEEVNENEYVGSPPYRISNKFVCAEPLSSNRFSYPCGGRIFVKILKDEDDYDDHEYCGLHGSYPKTMTKEEYEKKIKEIEEEREYDELCRIETERMRGDYDL